MKYCAFEQLDERTARCTNPDCGHVVKLPDTVTPAPDWVIRLRASCPRRKPPPPKLPAAPDPEARAKREAALTEGATRLGITLDDVGHYARAVLRWSRAGWPTRTDDEVAAIVEVCRACEAFVGGRCKRCGCRVNASRWAVANKARMGTERCPRGMW